jgi:hypothetical protein
MVELFVHLLRIRVVPGSNPGPETGYYMTRALLGFPQTLQIIT